MIDWSSSSGQKLQGRLETDRVVWLTTVTADQVPLPSVVWFLWDGAELLIYSQPGKPKLANIAERPAVALNFNSNPQGGDVVVVNATARLAPDMPPPHEHPAYLEKYGERMRGGWNSPEEFAAIYSEPLLVVPDRVRGG